MSAGSRTRGVPVEQRLTALLAEVLHQRQLDSGDRDLDLALRLLDELRAERYGVVDLVDIACGCIELLAQDQERDAHALLREILSFRARFRDDP